MSRLPSDVSVFTNLRDCPADVTEFFEKAEIRNIQFGIAWYQHLADTVLGTHGDACVYVLRRTSRLIVALPVLLRASGRYKGLRVESLSNFYTSLFEPALAADAGGADVSILIAAIARTHHPVESFRFAPMDPASAACRILEEGLQLARMKPFRFFCFGNWFLKVGDDWPAYIAGREGALRNTLKRMGNKFARAAGTLEVITGCERLEAGLRAYEQVYAASWKAAEPYPEFMPGLMRLCAERGWLRLGVAWLHGRAIGAQIWIVANGRAEIYKLAYDEDFKMYSPGSLLTALLMQRVFESGDVTEVDYLIGDDPYKKAWMSARRERWGIVAYNPKTLRGQVGYWRETLGRAIKPLRRALKARVHGQLPVLSTVRRARDSNAT